MGFGPTLPPFIYPQVTAHRPGQTGNLPQLQVGRQTGEAGQARRTLLLGVLERQCSLGHNSCTSLVMGLFDHLTIIAGFPARSNEVLSFG